MYSAANSGADARQLIAQRMSVVRGAMPLFTHHHLQLPLFTGQRRWHTMFGQLSQLASSGCGRAATLNTDEDILADSNFTSLFDTSSDSQCADSLCAVEPVNSCTACDMQATRCREFSRDTAMDFGESNFPALDENVDSMQSAVEQFMLNANIRQLGENTNRASPSLSVASTECSHDRAVHRSMQQTAHCSRGSLAVSTGSQSRTLLGRRHSDPGSIRSSATGSSSTNSNWYYYDRRLGPGGSLAAQYGRLQTRRCMSVIMFPPAYDDVVNDAQVDQQTADEHTTGQFPAVPESSSDHWTELPPPYQESSEQPPSYADVSSDATEQPGAASVDCVRPTGTETWLAADSHLLMTRYSHSRGLFTGRPAVRWNRNTRVERWTSSFNWVMS